MAKTLDWHIIICYLLLIFIGWINIYASIQSDDPSSIFDWSCRSGKQFIWFLTSIGLAGIILFVINPRAYEGLSLLLYLLMIGLLVAVIFLGHEVKGSHSWFSFGPIKFQPAEISKISTSLLLAYVMSRDTGILPVALQCAMGIALYAMFIALIVPAARESRNVLIVVIFAVLCTCALRYIPIFRGISPGFRIIISTVVAAGSGALLFPTEQEETEYENADQ